MSEVFAFVPSYNHAPFVERCLQSIIKQTVKPRKLLVIDDGSKDNSTQIIEKVLSDCYFDYELIVRENRGLCATLNEGFSRCNTEFFAYLGSDDVWLPTILEKRIELLEKRPAAVLSFGHAYLIDEYDRIIESTADYTDFADGDMLPLLLRGIIFPSSSVVYRSSALEKHGWNESSRLEDYELYLKLSADGEFAFDKSILSAWRQHGSNVSGDFPLMLEEWINAQNRLFQKLNIRAEELAKVQTELKFDSVLSYVRHVRRREAVKLFTENLSGAKSDSQIGKTIFRLSIPQTPFQWNMRRNTAKAMNMQRKLEP